MTIKCPPHNYQPRYDEKWPNGIAMTTEGIDAIKAIKDKTYVHDICTMCGDIKKREQAKGEK